MRVWPLVVALLLVPSVAAEPSDDSVTIRLRFMDSGEPLNGTLDASHWEDGAWRHAGGLLDQAGSATMDLRPGQWILQLRPLTWGGHLIGSGYLEVFNGFDATVDLAADEPTVPLDVSILDASTGRPVDVGEVAAHMLFGEYQCIGTRPTANSGQPSASGQPTPSSEPSDLCDLQWAEPGHLVGKVPPGVLTLRVLPQEVTCLYTPPVGHHPCHRHVPKSLSLAAVDGQPLAVTIPLLPVKEADAYVEGYLVSNITGHVIADKHISFQGTGDYTDVVFSASVDSDGSYRVGIPAGSYSAWAWACGHDELSLPLQVGTGETLRLDLRLPEAGSRPTPTPTMTATSTVAMTPTPTGTGPKADTTYPACDARTSDQEADPGATAEGSPPADSTEFNLVGTLAFIDFGGGLGPLGGVQANDDDDLASASSKGSPAPGPVMILLVLAMLAASARRRLLP